MTTYQGTISWIRSSSVPDTITPSRHATPGAVSDAIAFTYRGTIWWMRSSSVPDTITPSRHATPHKAMCRMLLDYLPWHHFVDEVLQRAGNDHSVTPRHPGCPPLPLTAHRTVAVKTFAAHNRAKRAQFFFCLMKNSLMKTLKFLLTKI